MIKLQLINADIIYDTAIVTSLLFRKSFYCRYNPRMDYAFCLLTLKSSENWWSRYIIWCCKQLQSPNSTLLYTRDVNRYWSSRRKLKGSKQIDADCAVEPSKLGALYDRGPLKETSHTTNMKPALPWMLAHLKIIWQFYAHPVHQKGSRYFGPRYIGDDLFLGPNLVSFNRAVVPLLELSFLTKSQKLSSA
jgi:hypothetical protein